MSSHEVIKLFFTAPVNSENPNALDDLRGGIRTDRRVDGRSFLAQPNGGCESLVVKYISPNFPIGEAQIISMGDDEVFLSIIGETSGSPTIINANETVILESSDPDHYVIIFRDAVYNSADLRGRLLLTVNPLQNGAISYTNVPTEITDIGIVGHWALFAEVSEPVTNFTLSIPPIIDTPEVTDISTLPSSGAGSIETSGSFAGWPQSGYIRIMNAAETVVLESAYYASRTDSTLTVPAEGRGLFDTGIAAGGITDVVYCVPGLAIAVEPLVDGVMQEIEDIFDEPAGVTWGFRVDQSNVSQSFGIWLRTDIPEGMSGTPEADMLLRIKWEHNSNTVDQTYHQIRSVQNAAIDRFLVYIGTGALPDLEGPPTGTVAPSLPFNISGLTGPATYHIVIQRRNAYGLKSFNRIAHMLELNGDDEEVEQPLTAPSGTVLDNLQSGYIRVRASYNPAMDQPEIADTWKVYVRDDGTEPDPDVDTPIEFEMVRLYGFVPTIHLDDRAGPFVLGAMVRVLVRTANEVRESINTTSVEITIDTAFAPPPVGVGLSGKGTSGHGPLVTDYFDMAMVDISTSTRFLLMNNETRLFRGDILVLRSLSDSVRTPLSLVQDFTINGAGSTLPLEVVNANTIYICVDGQRAALIDLAEMKLRASKFILWDADMPQVNSGTPAIALPGRTVFQTFENGRWATFMDVNAAGEIRTSKPLKQFG